MTGLSIPPAYVYLLRQRVDSLMWIPFRFRLLVESWIWVAFVLRQCAASLVWVVLRFHQVVWGVLGLRQAGQSSLLEIVLLARKPSDIFARICNRPEHTFWRNASR